MSEDKPPERPVTRKLVASQAAGSPPPPPPPPPPPSAAAAPVRTPTRSIPRSVVFSNDPVDQKVRAAAAEIEAKLASKLDLIEARFTSGAAIEALVPRIREIARDAAREAIAEAREGILDEAAQRFDGSASEEARAKERFVSEAAAQVVPKLVETFDAKAHEARLVERAVDATVSELKQHHDLDALLERLAGEANAKAFAVAREGLDRIVEKLTERIVRDASALAVPQIQKKLDPAAIDKRVIDEVSKLAAQQLVSQLDATKADLVALPEKIGREALAKALSGIEQRLANVDLSGIERRVRELAERPVDGGRGPALGDVESIVRRAVANAQIDLESATRKATEQVVEKAVAAAIAAIEPKIPPRVDTNALKAELYRAIRADLPSVASATPAGGTALPISEAHFKALAREVKALKQSFGQLLGREPGEAGPSS